MERIGAVILAAGMSRRMGESKLLLPLKDKPLFMHIVDIAVRCQLDPVVLVAGHHAESFCSYIPPEVHVEVNPEFASGMGSSLKCGIRCLKDQVDAAIVFLADQPLVPALVPIEMVKRYKEQKKHGCRIVKAKYDGEEGHPVLFDAELFDLLEHVSGDVGGRDIIRKHRTQLSIVSFSQKLWGKDIDTPEDYAFIKAMLEK